MGLGPWAERDLYERQKKAPVKIVLSPGTRLLVTLEESDGDFEILYNYEGDNKLRVLASFPDSTNRGGSEDLTSRDGQKFNPEIYCENFGDEGTQACNTEQGELSQESQDEEMLLAHEKQVLMNNIFPTKPPQVACSTAGCPRPGIIEGSKKPFMWCEECAADIAKYNREQEHLRKEHIDDTSVPESEFIDLTGRKACLTSGCPRVAFGGDDVHLGGLCLECAAVRQEQERNWDQEQDELWRD